MKNKLTVLCVAVVLSGCASLSEKNPEAYAESLAVAKETLKTNTNVDKYKKYYNAPNHKAFALSKVSSAAAYSSNHASKRSAMESALDICNERLLKKQNKITDKVSCEIVNVDNEWIVK